MSYYFKKKYKFSDHGFVRIKNRLKLKDKSDLEIINYCLSLIELSHEVYETKTLKYVKVNQTDLYFIINKFDNLIITLSPIKPGKLLANLDQEL
ncbi:MAG: hypothetical protein REH79_02715 [Spiroplasma sp.]|nr:hypothetical protein [Spiroplasma sp.]